MTDESAGQPVQQAAIPNPEIFTGNILNFERPKLNAQQENRLEALKCLKKKCAYMSGSIVNISKEGNVFWYKIGSDLKAKRFMTV